MSRNQRSSFIFGVNLTVPLFMIASASAAHAVECSDVRDPAARLQCYDMGAKPAVQQKIDTLPQAYEGDWSPNTANCTAPRDGNFSIKGNRYTEHEGSCQIQRVTPKGSGWNLHLDCEGEGMKFTKEIIFEMEGKDKIIANNDGTRTEKYLRCNVNTGINEDWRSYYNTRTGVSAIYPAHLIADGIMTDITDGMSGAATRPPTGMRYEGQDGIEGAIYGSAQPVNDPYIYICPKKCEGETYSVKRPALAVVSGKRGAFIYYKKCVLSSGSRLHCFEIEYPLARAKEFDPVVAKISSSLK